MSELRLFKPDDEIPLVKPYPWDIMIGNTPYYVTRFPDFAHSIGGRYGENDLWAWPRNEKPSYSNLIEFNGEPGACWGIRYEPTRYVRTKWGETSCEDSHKITITRNGEDFYVFYGDICTGIAKAQTYIAELNAHPLHFNDIDFDKDMIGREIWWRGEPAVITRWIAGEACVVLTADGIDRFSIPHEFEKDDIPYYEDLYDAQNVKTSVFDAHIWWFRD